MIWPVYIVYVSIVALIKYYKWLEFQVLKLFIKFLKKKGKEICLSVGVVLHCPGDNEELSAEEKEIIVKENKMYDKLVHIKVNDELFFARIANKGTLGFGESYMDKMWEALGGDLEDVTEFTTRLMENNLVAMYYNWWNVTLEWLELYAFNLQTRQRAFQVGKEHYDLGNDMFEIMLDPWMQYTCGYWKDVNNLNDAQVNKMELIAKKLELKPGMRVLDIGCGWGTLCKYLAENYGVECVGVTVGEEGVAYGKKLCEGLRVDIRLQDYRKVDEKFDRIVSVGMFEHVGYWNYREYFEVAEKCLVDDGIFLLHTIGRNHYNYPQGSDPWSDKYIFPNGQLPCPADIAEKTKNLFVIEDWHNFGYDYTKTLFCWRENFMNGWPKIEAKYGEGFYLMWTAYLSFARALFKSRRMQLWQIVLSKDGLKREYRAVR